MMYEHNGVSFVPPPSWVDRTVLAAAAPARPGLATPSFVVSDEPFEDGDTLRAYADRALLRASMELERFELLERREATLAGLPAVFARLRAVLGGRDLEQAVTFAARTTHQGLVVTTFTATAPGEDACAPVFDAILSSVRFVAPATR